MARACRSLVHEPQTERRVPARPRLPPQVRRPVRGAEVEVPLRLHLRVRSRERRAAAPAMWWCARAEEEMNEVGNEVGRGVNDEVSVRVARDDRRRGRLAAWSGGRT